MTDTTRYGVRVMASLDLAEVIQGMAGITLIGATFTTANGGRLVVEAPESEATALLQEILDEHSEHLPTAFVGEIAAYLESDRG